MDLTFEKGIRHQFDDEHQHGDLREDILSEKILSAIVEFKTSFNVPAILRKGEGSGESPGHRRCHRRCHAVRPRRQ
jgi:hypothetical protein